jgi:hypothetical protein
MRINGPEHPRKNGVPYSEVDMKISFALLCVLAFALPTNAQKPIDGRWESTFTGAQNEPIRVVFDLKAASEIVAGTVTSGRGSDDSDGVNSPLE